MLQKPVFLCKYYFLGYDYSIFWQASKDLAEWTDPYGRWAFVTPPLSAMLNLPLAGLSMEASAIVFFFFNIGSIFAGVFVALRGTTLDPLAKGAIWVTAACCSPTLLLIERGNIDGVVFLLVSIALRYWNRRIIPGLFLGLGICLKLYPAILCLPLLKARKRVALFVIAVIVEMSLLAFAPYVKGFLANQANRHGWMRLEGNLSFDGILFYVSKMMPSVSFAAGVLYLSVIVVTLVVAILFDARANGESRSDSMALNASYLVFAINVPDLVFTYSGVMILLVLIYALEEKSPVGKWSSLLLAVGASLVFFPAVSFNETFNGIGGFYFLNFLPPIGSFILLIYFVALRFEARSRSVSMDAAALDDAWPAAGVSA